jgi:hypothetical protein
VAYCYIDPDTGCFNRNPVSDVDRHTCADLDLDASSDPDVYARARRDARADSNGYAGCYGDRKSY